MQLPTHNQRGFAPIALVVLLFGIAAGTYLVQNRTNFLPKAAIDVCSDLEKKNCEYEGATSCKTSGGFHYCVDDGDNFCIQNTVYIHPKNDKDAINCATNLRYKDTPRCGFDKEFEAYTCVSQATYDAWLKDVAAKKSASDTKPATLKDCTNQTYKDICTAQAKAHPDQISSTCYMIDGDSPRNAKCIHKTDSCADEADINGCKSKGGCEVRTQNSAKGVIKYSACKNDPPLSAAAPGAPAHVAPPAAGVPPAGAQSAARPAAGNANIPCSGADQMINGVPCYKIGVFDEKTGVALEEQARIAYANYKIYEQVLTDLGNLIEATAKSRAHAALKTARDATACMNRTTTTPATNTTTNSSANTTTNKPVNSTANPPTNTTADQANTEKCEKTCCRTYRPGKRDGFPNDTCTKGYVYETRSEGGKCKIDSDPIPDKNGNLCRTRPW